MIRKPHLQHNNNNALPKHCQNMTKGLSITTVAAFLRLLDISKAKFFFFFQRFAVNTPRATASLQPDMRKGITYKTTTRY